MPTSIEVLMLIYYLVSYWFESCLWFDTIWVKSLTIGLFAFAIDDCQRNDWRDWPQLLRLVEGSDRVLGHHHVFATSGDVYNTNCCRCLPWIRWLRHIGQYPSWIT